MNLLHMRYAVEVARLGSLKRAADVLLVAQPNISRSIKELEGDLGIALFIRSARGMELTPEGEEFIGYAKSILAQMEEVEGLYKKNASHIQRFSVAMPPVAYMAEAVAAMLDESDAPACRMLCRETDNRTVISLVSERECRLGIIRYAAMYDPYFKPHLEERGLIYEVVAEFTPSVLVSARHPLAGRGSISLDELAPYTEIAETDVYVPTLSPARVEKELYPTEGQRRMYASERAVRMDLVAGCEGAYVWSSPLPEAEMTKYGLVRLSCADARPVYKDVLIHREGYRLSLVDRRFVTALCEARRRAFRA